MSSVACIFIISILTLYLPFLLFWSLLNLGVLIVKVAANVSCKSVLFHNNLNVVTCQEIAQCTESLFCFVFF